MTSFRTPEPYPIQAYVTIPLSKPPKLLSYQESRIQVGRQLLTEGFEMAILDGVQVPYYWSPTGGFWFFAGGDHVLEDENMNLVSQLYGGSIFEEFDGVMTKVGYVEKNMTGANQTLIHGQVMRGFDVPMAPIVLLKGQLDTASLGRANQAITEIQLTPTNQTTLIVDYNVRDVNQLYNGNQATIYNLFAISPVKSYDASLTWSPSWFTSIGTTFKRLTYLSQAGNELAYEADLFSIHRFRYSNFSPIVSFIYSYGLPTYDFGGKYRVDLTHTVTFETEADVAHIDKINGINGWAYHDRSGLDFSPLPQLLTRALVEFESNHIFSFDARLAAYVSYFTFKFISAMTILMATLALASGLEPAPSMGVPSMIMPTLSQPLDRLFSHPKHKKTFEKMGMTCTTCHNFSVHGKESGPLSPPVQGGYLTPVKQICHQCHLGKVSFPRSNQCQLCHTNVENLNRMITTITGCFATAECPSSIGTRALNAILRKAVPTATPCETR